MTSRLTRRTTSTQPHLSTPIITLSPPTVMNSLPISLYSHTLCSGTSCHIGPQYWHLGRRIGAQICGRRLVLVPHREDDPG